MAPVLFLNEISDGRIGFEAITGSLGYFGPIAGIEKIKCVIKILGIAAKLCQVHSQAFE